MTQEEFLQALYTAYKTNQDYYNKLVELDAKRQELYGKGETDVPSKVADLEAEAIALCEIAKEAQII